MADVKLLPLENHVIVQTKPEEKTTKSGIILTDTNKEKPSEGVVIAVGPGAILDNGNRGPMDVAVGDTVYFTKYAPDEIKVTVDGEEVTYLVVKVSSILAKKVA